MCLCSIGRQRRAKPLPQRHRQDGVLAQHQPQIGMGRQTIVAHHHRVALQRILQRLRLPAVAGRILDLGLLLAVGPRVAEPADGDAAQCDQFLASIAMPGTPLPFAMSTLNGAALTLAAVCPGAGASVKAGGCKVRLRFNS